MANSTRHYESTRDLPIRTPSISFSNIKKQFDDGTVALADVSFDVPHGGFVSIVGPSGCGKSTLLRIASGMDAATGGTASRFGSPISGLDDSVGFVTQDSNLYPWLTLRANVEFALTMRKVPTAEKRQRSDILLDIAGLTGFEDKYPYQLSGGMQKRASVIRTIIYEPEIVLMDEPFGALDAQTKLKLQSELLNIIKEDQTILFVTHDLREALALSDRVVALSGRPAIVAMDLEVPFARPRNIVEIHREPGFADLHTQLWEAMQS